MARITNADLYRLKHEVSILELCRSRGIRLKRTAKADALAGRCPFPRCRKPAFVALAAANLFHCTECRAGGNALDLVAKLDGCDYRQAAETLLAALPQIRKAFARKGGLHAAHT